MVVTHHFREIFFRYAYLETIALLTIYLLIGYFVYPDDICMIDTKVSFITIIFAIITLFHGISSGLLATVVIGIAMKLGYPEFNYEVFLKELMLVLIFGEFHYYWNRTIKQYKAQSQFANKKLGELGKAFYMLKVSHDQIEKSYVTKPMSLRNSILSIKESLKGKDMNIAYEQFLSLIKKTANIEIAHLGSIEDENNDKVSILTHSADAKPFDESDLMVQKAIEKRMPVYVSSDEENHASQYLAVIPAVSNNELIGLLVIEEMPFLSFNKDSLITIAILVTYFFDELNKAVCLKDFGASYKMFEDDFRFEVYRQNNLYTKYGVNSTILLFKSYDKLETHLLIESLEQNTRALEEHSYVLDTDHDAIALLFPFVDKSSVKGFIDRVDMLKNEETQIVYSSFYLSELDLLAKYAVDDK